MPKERRSGSPSFSSCRTTERISGDYREPARRVVCRSPAPGLDRSLCGAAGRTPRSSARVTSRVSSRRQRGSRDRSGGVRGATFHAAAVKCRCSRSVSGTLPASSSSGVSTVCSASRKSSRSWSTRYSISTASAEVSSRPSRATDRVGDLPSDDHCRLAYRCPHETSCWSSEILVTRWTGFIHRH